METPRLWLRPFDDDDSDEAYHVLEGHPDVWRYDPGFARTREQRAALIHRYATQNALDGPGTLAVIHKESGALLGYVGLQLYLLPTEPLSTPEVELYYKLGRAYWGQGYAYEACRAMIRFAFDKLRLARLVTVTHRDNQPSIRLMERLGMRIEAAPPQWPDDLIGILENDRHHVTER
jgi:RimJ/RimL family protein N-acetyltransferase